MQKATEQVIESGMADRIIRDTDLQSLFGGTPASRYALVNKALKQAELIRICRGLYVLAKKYRKQRPSQFCISNHIAPGSFVTAESALSYHGLIPERIAQVTAIAPTGRSREFNTPFGQYVYRVPSIEEKHFYYGVYRETVNSQAFLLASPLRALMDYVAWHNVQDLDLDFLEHSLRIESEDIPSVMKQEIKQYSEVYKSKHVYDLLVGLQGGKVNAK